MDFKKISRFVVATTLRKFHDEDAVKVDRHPQKYVNYTSNQKHIIKELVIFRWMLSFATMVKISKNHSIGQWLENVYWFELMELV